MTTEPVPVPIDRASPPGGGDQDRTPSIQDTFRRWMSEELSLRIKRGWLAGAALAFVVLALLAFD